MSGTCQPRSGVERGVWDVSKRQNNTTHTCPMQCPLDVEIIATHSLEDKTSQVIHQLIYHTSPQYFFHSSILLSLYLTMRGNITFWEFERHLCPLRAKS